MLPLRMTLAKVLMYCKCYPKWVSLNMDIVIFWNFHVVPHIKNSNILKWSQGGAHEKFSCFLVDIHIERHLQYRGSGKFVVCKVPKWKNSKLEKLKNKNFEKKSEKIGPVPPHMGISFFWKIHVGYHMIIFWGWWGEKNKKWKISKKFNFEVATKKFFRYKTYYEFNWNTVNGGLD